MPALLFIPWFRLEAWDAPVQPLGVLLAAALMFAAPQVGALASKVGLKGEWITRHVTFTVLAAYALGHAIGAALGQDAWTLAIQPFGLLVATGVLSGARLAEWRAAKLGLRRELISDHIAHVVIIGFVLGHMFDAVFYTPEELKRDPLYLFKVWTGLSSFGGFFGAAIGAFIWKWRRGVPLVPFFDQVAFGLPLGWFFGRMGCFVVHDHPGKPSDFFLAVANYEWGTPPYVARHDLGLYEVIWAALVVPLFLYLQRKPRPYGFFIGMIAILYAPVRFGLDYLRVADPTYVLGLTPGHWSALLALGLGIWSLWRAYHVEPPHLPPQALAVDPPADAPAPA